MVADNKQQSVSEKEVPPTSIQVGGDGQSKRKLRFHLPKINKKSLLYLLLVVVIVVGGGLVLRKELHIGEKVYAQAAGHKVYKQDIDNLIGNTKGVSNHQAATVLADQYLTKAMAKKEGITVTSQDIEAKYGPVIEMQKKDNKYAYQYQVNQLYFDRLQQNQQGIYKGDLLVAHFSRYVPYQSALLAQDKAAEPNIGNPAAIAADKKYAQDFITNLYNQLKTNKITWDQAIETEHNDPVVGESAYETLSHSGPFDTSVAPASLLQPISAQQQIRGLKMGQTSQPFVVRVSDSDSVTDNSTAESYFLVVKMDSILGKPNGLSFDQYVAQSKQEFKYKVYA